MDKLYDVCFCFALSAIMGLSWGGFFYWFYPVFALPVGLVLFCLCFLALMHACFAEDEEDEYTKHNRRFNDI